MTKSKDNKFLYSISDMGIESFKILSNGDLEHLNTGSIRGMRGCYLTVTSDDKYIACAGYHDGKVTVLRLNEDGSVGEIVSEVFHHGMGSVAEKNFRPHVSCVKFTPDEKFLCAVDYGLDQVKIYKFDHETGALDIIDIIRCELDSAPRRMRFTLDGKFAYILFESAKKIGIYKYSVSKNAPDFEFVDFVGTIPEEHARGSAASGLTLSWDGRYIMASNDGENSVAIFKIDHRNGSLEEILNLPISGHYPKDVCFFPDDRHILSMNHESGTLTTLEVDYKENNLYWKNAPVELEEPNCAMIVKVPGEEGKL
jgi:6-phosphogluconolactonase